jgi:hypothetical protein
MRYTLLQIERAGTNTGALIRAQVDQASDKELIEHQQVWNYRGYDLFKIITLGWPASLIQRDDIVIDTLFTDPETATLFRYKVVGRVRNHDRHHQECYCEVTVGS